MYVISCMSTQFLLLTPKNRKQPKILMYKDLAIDETSIRNYIRESSSNVDEGCKQGYQIYFLEYVIVKLNWISNDNESRNITYRHVGLIVKFGMNWKRFYVLPLNSDKNKLFIFI